MMLSYMMVDIDVITRVASIDASAHVDDATTTKGSVRCVDVGMHVC